MKISSTSSGYASASSASAGTDDLEKQKTKLEADIKTEQQSKDDEKTKEKKLELLQAQLQQIEQQIAQRKNGASAQTAAAGQTDGKATDARTARLGVNLAEAEGGLDISI